MIYVNPRLRQDILWQRYSQDYFQDEYLPQHGEYNEQVNYAIYAPFLRELVQYVPARGRLLDVGCAIGLFLAAARVDGWEVIGNELSPFAARYALEQFNIPVIAGDFEELDLAPGGLDAVTMWDVVEHVRSPRAVLQKAAELIRPGGALALSTPNVGGLMYRCLRDRWWIVAPKEHIFYFTPKTITRLLEQTGFEVKRLWTTGFDFRYFRHTLLGRMVMPWHIHCTQLRAQATAFEGDAAPGNCMAATWLRWKPRIVSSVAQIIGQIKWADICMYTRFGACNLWGDKKQSGRRAQSYIVIFFVLVMLVSGALPSRAGSSQPQSVTVTDPSGLVAFGETPEYATWVWNDPWDMLDPLDVQQLDSPRCVWPNHFNDYSPCSSGVWCGRVRSNVSDPDLFLLHPGYSGALHAGRRTGQLRPINADYYTQLTFRMYIDSVDHEDPGWQVIWTDGTVADIGADPRRYGGSHLFKTYSGWHIYTVDLGTYRNGTPPSSPGRLPWAGQLTGLRLDPGLVNMNNKVVMLDWVRLTPRQTRPIAWSTNQSGSVKIMLQSSAGTDEVHMYTIRSRSAPYTEWTEPLTIPSSWGLYDLPVSLPPGDWYVKLEIKGQVSAPAGPWRIQQAPTLRFLKPGYTSGEDFAQAVLHNAWDMSNPGDIYSYANTTPPVFSGGILVSTSIDSNPLNTCSGYWEDPQIILLNGNGAIDTSKYRYLTFRLKLDGTPDVSYGWVARVNWAGSLSQDCGITDDVPLHAGWNEVSIDLWNTNILEPEARDCQSRWQAKPFRPYLRLDPLESPEAVTFYVDSVMLTASDTASRGSFFEIRYELNKSENVKVAFYYDTDRNPANGRLPAIEYIPPPPIPPTGPHFVYVPLVLKQFSGSMSGRLFFWNLTNVAPGSYYISAEVDDGYNRTTWYSETPVVVTE